MYFADVGNNGTVEVLQESHNYPFGMQMQGISANSSPNNLYQYNGKELNVDLGLYWIDYGARWQDPQLGRWWSVDPLADHPNQIDKSPLAYAWNNPVLLTDPDGQCPVCIQIYLREKGRSVVNWIGNKISRANAKADGYQRAYQTITGSEPSVSLKASAYTNSYLGEFGTFSDANDGAVLVRGENLDGTKAKVGDYVFAGMGVFIPFASGGAVKELLEEGFTTMYRAISKGELDDIATNKLIRMDPSGLSMEGKLFTETYDDAVAQGKETAMKFHIIQIDVPNSTYQQLETIKGLDSKIMKGNTIAVQPDKYDLLNNTIEGINVIK